MLKLFPILLFLPLNACVHKSHENLVEVVKRTETSVLVEYYAPSSYEEKEGVYEEIKKIGYDSCMEDFDLGTVRKSSRSEVYRTSHLVHEPARHECRQVYDGTDSFTRASRYRTECRMVTSSPTTRYETKSRLLEIHRRWIVCREDEVLEDEIE